MAFGKSDGEYGDSTMGLTLGMLGAKSGSGKLRATRKKETKKQSERTLGIASPPNPPPATTTTV